MTRNEIDDHLPNKTFQIQRIYLISSVFVRDFAIAFLCRKRGRYCSVFFEFEFNETRIKFCVYIYIYTYIVRYVRHELNGYVY